MTVNGQPGLAVTLTTIQRGGKRDLHAVIRLKPLRHQLLPRRLTQRTHLLRRPPPLRQQPHAPALQMPQCRVRQDFVVSERQRVVHLLALGVAALLQAQLLALVARDGVSALLYGLEDRVDGVVQRFAENFCSGGYLPEPERVRRVGRVWLLGARVPVYLDDFDLPAGLEVSGGSRCVSGG